MSQDRMSLGHFQLSVNIQNSPFDLANRISSKKIANGRHHRHEPDLCLQSQTAIAAHILDLVKRNQPSSEVILMTRKHVKMTRHSVQAAVS